MEEWVEVIGVGTVQVLEELRSVASIIRLGKDLESRIRGTIATSFSSNDQNGTVGHDHGSGIPALNLHRA